MARQHNFRKQVTGFMDSRAPNFARRSVLRVDQRPAQISELERALGVTREAPGVVRHPFDVCAGRAQREQADFSEIVAG